MPEQLVIRSEPVFLRGVWCAVIYRDGRRSRPSLGTTDESEAKAALARLRADLSRPKEQTVRALWGAYTAENEGRAVVGTMEHTWKALRADFGALQPCEITFEHCRAHATKRRAAGIRDGTIWTELGHLRMVLLWAQKRRYIAEAPHIERPPKPDPKDRWLTKREALRLMQATTMPHLRLFIVLALGTAGRKDALLGLKWERVDFERGVISLRDPNDPARRKGRATVPMNRMLRAALKEARQGARTDYVIEWAGKRVQSMKKGLATTARKAGLGEIGAHMLRHTAAVWMAQAGRPMPRIAEYLGHSDSRITERVYARHGPDHLREEAEALEFDDLGGAFAPKSEAGR